MARITKLEKEKKITNIRLAMVRGFTPAEIMEAEKISQRTLERYVKIIETRKLLKYPKLTKTAKQVFLTQIERMEDIIRQANRKILANPHGNISGYLKVIMQASKAITDYMFKIGFIPEAPKEYRITEQVDIQKTEVHIRGIAAQLIEAYPEVADKLLTTFAEIKENAETSTAKTQQ